jgi:acyl carrier protein
MTVKNDFPAGAVAFSRERVLSDVKRIVGEEAGIAPEHVKETNALEGDLAYDSLMIVNTVMEIEDHFGITVPDELGQKVRTVGDIVDGVWQLLRVSRAE